MKSRFLGVIQQRSCTNLAFVPKHKCVENQDVEKLQEFVGEAKNMLVITGAGET